MFVFESWQSEATLVWDGTSKQKVKMTQTKTSTVAANNQTIQDGVRHRKGYKNVIIIRRKYMTRTQSSIKHESETRAVARCSVNGPGNFYGLVVSIRFSAIYCLERLVSKTAKPIWLTKLHGVSESLSPPHHVPIAIVYTIAIQVGQLSQTDRAVGSVNFGKNISARRIVHQTLSVSGN